MSSLALVPFTFPVLKLPFVALQNVANCLNPFENYHFSRISKKTKKLAKVFSKKVIRISLSLPSRILIEFKKDETWFIIPRSLHDPDFYMGENQVTRAYAFPSKNPALEVLKVLERVIDLFKCSMIRLDFDTHYSTRHDLISCFNWFVENPSVVSLVSMTCSQAEGVQFFLENYKKPSKKLYLQLCYENDDELDLPDNLGKTLFEEVEIYNSHPVNFKLYNIFNCSILDSYERQITNQDLNTFIKNWQLGLTHSRWRSVCITVTIHVNLKDVLKDITATYRDPRTVKRQINVDKESFWIFGGIDIQKHDGSATATIQWMEYKVDNEESEVPNELIEEYERNMETGEIQSREEDQFEHLLQLHEFSMYIW